MNSFKIIMLGDMSVGKTCLVMHLVNEKFSDFHLNTIGIDRQTKNFHVNKQDGSTEQIRL